MEGCAWELGVFLASGERLAFLSVEPSLPVSSLVQALQPHLPKDRRIAAFLVDDGPCFSCCLDCEECGGSSNDSSSDRSSDSSNSNQVCSSRSTTVADLEAKAGRGSGSVSESAISGRRIWQAVLTAAWRPGSYNHDFVDIQLGMGNWGPQSTEVRATYTLTLGEDSHELVLHCSMSGLVDHNPYSPMITELYGVPRVNFAVAGRLTENGDLLFEQPLPKGFEVELNTTSGSALSLKATMPVITVNANQHYGGTEVKEIRLVHDHSS